MSRFDARLQGLRRMSTPDRLTLVAPAKLNLTLHVRGRRPDGFHDIRSWVCLIDLADTLDLQRRVEGVALTCDDPAIPTDESNLVCRAARLLAEEAGRPAGLAAHLKKRIPAGGGLGGGSSDAAATLKGACELWGLSCPRARLASIGARIGSDVPLFIHGRSAVIEGRGEIVHPVDRPLGGSVVLIVPPFGAATPAVYRELRRDEIERMREPPAAFWNRPVGELGNMLYNDLEGPAFRLVPPLAELHREVDGLGGVPVRMSGSGSTLFALFADSQGADAWRREATARLGDRIQLSVCSILATT